MVKLALPATWAAVAAQATDLALMARLLSNGVESPCAQRGPSYAMSAACTPHIAIEDERWMLVQAARQESVRARSRELMTV